MSKILIYFTKFFTFVSQLFLFWKLLVVFRQFSGVIIVCIPDKIAFPPFSLALLVALLLGFLDLPWLLGSVYFLLGRAELLIFYIYSILFIEARQIIKLFLILL